MRRSWLLVAVLGLMLSTVAAKPHTAVEEVKEAKEVKHEGKEGENATKQEAHQEKAVHAAEHDAYAEVVQKARAGHHADSPKHDGGDTYQGRPEYKDEPALTAEDALMYADQQQPDWEPYGDNEAVGDMRNKDFDEEYKRYLEEMRKEMEADPSLAEEIITNMERVEEDGHMLSDKDEAIQRLAFQVQAQARSQLEEQEREILNRQRRDVKHKMHREEGLGPEKAGQFGFNDPSDPFWHDENVDASRDKLKKIVHNRAQLLHNVDRRRREAFLEHEMERLLEYRELVQRTTDPRIKEALIEAHNAENRALKAAHAAEPGKEAAFKEEWEAEGFDADSFEPKTMFRLADTSGDEVLDEKEIEALVHRQAERVHAAKHGAAVDMAAIAEEAARMREHMMELMDMDHDRLVSYKEFMDATKTESFKQDAGWQPVNPNEEIKDKLEAFEQHRREVMRSAHKQVDPNIVDSVGKAVEHLTANLNHPVKKKKAATNNPFGKLAEKMGGEQTGWGKIAKTWGQPRNSTKKVKKTEVKEVKSKVKVVKDV